MHLLDLNDDILLYIATQSLLSRTVLSIMSRTCSKLHDLLSPALLREPVALDRSNLASFALFVHAGCLRNPAFSAPLRCINFDFWQVPDALDSPTLEDSVPLLSGLLECTQHLTELSIQGIVLALTPEDLRKVLASLPTLQSVKLYGLTRDYHDVLTNVCPGLKTIVLAFMEDDSPHTSLPVDPRPFLQTHGPSITKLVLSGVTLDASGTRCPGIVDLQIVDYSVRNADSGLTGPLVHLFPNVEHAHLLFLQRASNATTFSFRQSLDLHTALKDLRTAAARWQTTHGSWPNGLRFLEVESLVGLYCLGLRCDAARVKIWIPSDPFRIAHTALADVRPRCLQFSVSRLLEMEDVLRLLDAVSQTRSLDHLIIDISPGLLHELSFHSLLSQVGDALRDSHVSHILVHVSNGDDEGEPLLDEPPELLLSPHGDMRTEEPLLGLLANGNRRFHRLFLEVKGHSLRAWECGITDGQGVQELDEADARRILVREDMLL
ncbi:hypothetical protein PYCCODRAFT_946596 [Trametes coccinea BRFM310]|uniref:F-box domain-containing protein n=1 Tax=Trametes coccinea (strain BRFM310) TaxID=1353009 RepID=A0A1Y2IZI4_TRAC3|nr:hypothetical protein PYCCODRAFT_946596 [Trametes coccinea BRFM310]